MVHLISLLRMTPIPSVRQTHVLCYVGNAVPVGIVFYMFGFKCTKLCSAGPQAVPGTFYITLIIVHVQSVFYATHVSFAGCS